MTKILIVNPRAMYFGERRATSIDLCVRDLVRFSRFKDSTIVVGDAVDEPFPDIHFRARPATRSQNFYVRARALLSVVRDLAPDVISVQEHLRTASYLAKRLPIPVLLHHHNPIKPPKNIIDGFNRTRQYNNLAGQVFVSSSLRDDFSEHWPTVATPRHIVFNGLDMTAWKSAVLRENVIFVVGRASPQKGIAQAAQALASILPRYPGWKTIFMLNEVQADETYLADVQAIIRSIGQQAELLVQRPFAEVKAHMEKSAIAIVPSIWKEAFGRTALEAHAGGAAVISSGSGGLREVSGENAIFLPAVTPKHIAEAVADLIENPNRREILTAAGRERAARLFDARTVAAVCDDVYIQALKGFRAG